MTTEQWELESAEGRHARSPDTFWIPPAHRRDRVAPGQGVKLLFRFRSGDDEVVAGAEVSFRAEHIADIDSPPPDYEP